MWRKAERQRNIVDKEQWWREQREAGHDSVALREGKGLGSMWAGRLSEEKTMERPAEMPGTGNACQCKKCGRGRRVRSTFWQLLGEDWKASSHCFSSCSWDLQWSYSLLRWLHARFHPPVTHFWDGQTRAEGFCPARMSPVRMACKHPWA